MLAHCVLSMDILYYNMDIKPNVKLIHLLLEAMLEAPPLNPQTIDKVTLLDLRPRGITQSDVAKYLGNRGRTTISRWESGIGVDGIKPQEIQKLAILYGRNPVEILAAIDNTRLPTEEENN